MVVVDASVVVAGLLDPRGPAAAAMAGAGELAAPELLDLEVTQEIRGRVAGSKLREAEARQAIHRLRQLGIWLHGHRPMLDRIWELRDSLTAYDASYAALAERLQVALVTADRGLAACPGLRCEVHLLTARTR